MLVIGILLLLLLLDAVTITVIDSISSITIAVNATVDTVVLLDQCYYYCCYYYCCYYYCCYSLLLLILPLFFIAISAFVTVSATIVVILMLKNLRQASERCI